MPSANSRPFSSASMCQLKSGYQDDSPSNALQGDMAYYSLTYRQLKMLLCET